jgi:hypothetical protein
MPDSTTLKSKVATSRKSKSPALKPTREKDPGQLRLLLHRLAGEARLARHQRSLLPMLLRAKIECAPSLKAQADRFISCNAAMADALHTALGFKSLTPSERGDVTEMIVRLVLYVAEQKSELLSPTLRSAAELYLGQTLDEHLREDLNSFELVHQTGPDVDPKLLEQFKGQVKHARSSIDLERISAETRRLFYPNCVGDLEYFAKKAAHDEHLISKTQNALDMINKFKAQDNPFEFENSNIIRHNFTVREGSGDRQNHWIDLIERLDEVESDSHFGSFEALIDQLNDDERRVLATGLSAQTKMIHHENHLILCHPDAQPIAELVEEITELIDLEPSIRLQVMIDREIFYRQIIYDIEVNRSVKKLRRLMAEYRNTTEDYA